MQSSRDSSSAETGGLFRPYEMVQTWCEVTMPEARPGGDKGSMDVSKFENTNSVKACATMVPFT